MFGILILFFGVKGKSTNAATNRTSTMRLVDRTGEVAIREDSIKLDDNEIVFRLPKNFFFENQNSTQGKRIEKLYFNYNYSTMLEVSLCKNHTKETVIYDNENKDIVADFREREISADVWLEKMQITYLGQAEDNIETKEINGNKVKYFTWYYIGEDEIAVGRLVAVVELSGDAYYCVDISETEKGKTPDIGAYKYLFDIDF